MAVFAPIVQELIDELGRLPGVGPKSAQRIAYHLLKRPKDDALRLSNAIVRAKERVSFCRRCFNIAEVAGEGPTSPAGVSLAESLADAECAICRDSARDSKMICVVEEPKDIVAVERTREFTGRYHVLQGAINHLEGIGPDQLRVKELLTRIGAEDVQEVILCTNPNIDGEATAMYLARLLTPLGVPVSRIASGLPVGGDLEYADELTLGRALEGRRRIGG
jgi:recombination protein RecR